MKEPTATLRQRLRDAAAEAMLDAAEAVMIQKGYDKATMHEIAAAVGCATGTFYLYFKNKEELFQAICARHSERMFEGARSDFAKGDSPLEKIRAGVRHCLQYASQNRPFFRLFFSAMPMRHRAMFKQLDSRTRQDHEAYNQIELEQIRLAQKSRQVRSDIPAESLQEFMEAVAVSMFEQFAFATGRQAVDEQMKLLWGLMTGGLGAARSAP